MLFNFSLGRALPSTFFQSLQRNNYYLDPLHFYINVLFICLSHGAFDLLKRSSVCETSSGKETGPVYCTHGTKKLIKCCQNNFRDKTKPIKGSFHSVCPFTYNLPCVLCQRLSIMSSSGPSSQFGQTGPR